MELEPVLPRGPLLDDNAKIVELLNGGLDIAADLDAIFAGGFRGFGHGDHTAVPPGAGRNSDYSPGQIGGAQLELLAPRRLGAKQRSLSNWAGIGVSQNDPKGKGVGADRKKGIGPLGRIVDIDIKALGGQRDLGELGPLLVALGCGGLDFFFCIDRILSHTLDSLLFLVTRNENKRKKQEQGQNAFEMNAGSHNVKDSSSRMQGFARKSAKRRRRFSYSVSWGWMMP